MLTKWEHTVQGSDVEKITFTTAWNKQGFKLSIWWKNFEGDKILIAGNAFRPDNNVKSLMQMSMA